MPVNSIDSGYTWFRLRAGRLEPQTMSTKFSERETSSDRRSFNDFFNDSASATKRSCKLLVAQSVTLNIQADMRVGSIPTLDSASKRYDMLELPEYFMRIHYDGPWTQTLATSAHLTDVRGVNDILQRQGCAPRSPCFIKAQLLFILVSS